MGVNGGQNNDTFSMASGAAYVFERDVNGAWAQTAYIKASDSELSHGFGSSVIVEHDARFYVGAEGRGAVFVFEKTGTQGWMQAGIVESPEPDEVDLFGASLAADSGTMAIGATPEDSSATGINGNRENNSARLSGAVYVRRIAP